MQSRGGARVEGSHGLALFFEKSVISFARRADGKDPMTSLTKAEYPAYQGGQDRALVLTAALWGLLIGGLFGLDAAVACASQM